MYLRKVVSIRGDGDKNWFLLTIIALCTVRKSKVRRLMMEWVYRNVCMWANTPAIHPSRTLINEIYGFNTFLLFVI
jgi:hypothetical protein